MEIHIQQGESFRVKTDNTTVLKVEQSNDHYLTVTAAKADAPALNVLVDPLDNLNNVYATSGPVQVVTGQNQRFGGDERRVNRKQQQPASLTWSAEGLQQFEVEVWHWPGEPDAPHCTFHIQDTDKNDLMVEHAIDPHEPLEDGWVKVVYPLSNLPETTRYITLHFPETGEAWNPHISHVTAQARGARWIVPDEPVVPDPQPDKVEWGFTTGHITKFERDETIEKALSLVSEAGGTQARIGVSGPSDKLDRIYDIAFRLNIRLLPVYWKRRAKNTYGTSSDEEANQRELRAFVARYKPFAVVVDNEPNLNKNWRRDDAGAQAYKRHLDASYQTIKSVSADIEVWHAGISEWHMETWCQLMEKHGIWTWDRISYHPYAGNHAPTAAQAMKRFHAFRGIQAQWGPDHNRMDQIAITEIGFRAKTTSGHWENHVPAMAETEEDKAEQGVKTVQLLRAEGVHSVYVYELHHHAWTEGFGAVKLRENDDGFELEKLPLYEALKAEVKV